MGKTLIWSDVHHRTNFLRYFLEEYGNEFDRRVFHGDFQDSWHDTVEHAQYTAEYVKELLQDSRNTILFGNHDIPYAFPDNKFLWCPGFDIAKCKVINSILSLDDWKKVKLIAVVDNWLISHAGVHFSIFREIHDRPKIANPILISRVMDLCAEAMVAAEKGIPHPVLLPGRDRGFATQSVGGITWLDWGSLVPINGINQIVGHTILKEPQVKFQDMHGYRALRRWQDWEQEPNKEKMRSINWCIDTDNNYFGVIENGNFTIYECSKFH